MAVIRGADEILHPRVIGIHPEVNLQVSEDIGEGLEVDKQSFLRTLLLEFWLSVSDQLLNVEHARNAGLDLVLGNQMAMRIIISLLFADCSRYPIKKEALPPDIKKLTFNLPKDGAQIALCPHCHTCAIIMLHLRSAVLVFS